MREGRWWWEGGGGEGREEEVGVKGKGVVFSIRKRILVGVQNCINLVILPHCQICKEYIMRGEVCMVLLQQLNTPQPWEPYIPMK